MKVLFTGQTGLDKKAVLRRLEALCHERGHRIDAVYHLGDLMYEESEKAGKVLKRGKILDLPPMELALLRRTALWRVGSEMAGKQSAWVNSHAVFRWDNQLLPAFRLSDFEAFRPDAIITLVDDLDVIKLRLDSLRAKGQLPSNSHFTLKDILVWREEEILASRFLAEALGVLFFIAGVSLDPQVDPEPLRPLYSLLFEPWKKRAYVSYPISDAQGNPDVWKRVVRFRKLVRGHVAAFDPLIIDEKRLESELNRTVRQDPDAKTFTVNVRGGTALDPERSEGSLRVSVEEVREVLPDIDGQILARDYALIDQSDMIIAYFPLDADGTVLIAGGVQSEIEHAAAFTKDVVIVWEAPRQPTPFIGMRIDHKFSKLEELERFLAQQVSGRPGQPRLA